MKKTKKTSRIKLACQLIQLFARLRDTDKNGNGRCCSCGKSLRWGEGQGGHWHPKTRGYNAACLMVQNVNLQCCQCNLFKQGNVAAYTEYMIETYGEDIISEISSMSTQILDKSVIEEKITNLRTLCKDLASRKNFTVRIP
jgi:hypothetical protein